MKKLNSQAGFTILELMIATVVFSVMLMGAATMLVQIGRLYYKGVVTSRTQETVRTITDDIGRTLQFSGEQITVNDPAFVELSVGGVTKRIYAFCIGDVRYSYSLDTQVSGSVDAYTPGGSRENFSRRALWRDEGRGQASCPPVNIYDDAEVAATDGREMLGEGMRLFQLARPTDDQDTGLSRFAVGVVYGLDDELIVFSDADGEITGATCRGVGLGAQWCATSQLETTVFRRIQ